MIRLLVNLLRTHTEATEAKAQRGHWLEELRWK